MEIEIVLHFKTISVHYKKILMQSINSPEMFVFLKENHCSILKILVLATNVHLHINGQYSNLYISYRLLFIRTYTFGYTQQHYQFAGGGWGGGGYNNVIENKGSIILNTFYF